MRRLTIVTDRAATAQPIPVAHNTEHSLSERIQRPQAEARLLAGEQTSALSDAIRHVVRLAEDVAGGGDAFAVGVRELARRMADELPARANTLDVLAGRAGR